MKHQNLISAIISCTFLLTITSEKSVQNPLFTIIKNDDYPAIASHVRYQSYLLMRYNDSGFTPLTFALSVRKPQAVRELLKHGAQSNQEDNNGRLPLEVAIGTDQEDMVCLLMQYQADVNAKGSTDTPLISLAVLTKQIKLCKALLPNVDPRCRIIEYCKLVEKKDQGQTTDDSELIQLLKPKTTEEWTIRERLRQDYPLKPCETSLKDHFEKDAHIASLLAILFATCQENSLQKLCKIKDNPLFKEVLNRTYQKKETALGFAVRANRTQIALQLLELGADSNIPNQSGQFPLMLAAHHNNCELVEALHRKSTQKTRKAQCKQGFTAAEYYKNSPKREKIEQLVGLSQPAASLSQFFSQHPSRFSNMFS